MTAGPASSTGSASSTKVRACARRIPSVSGPVRSRSSATSAAAKIPSHRQRSSQAQQPNRSANTDDATSVTPIPSSASRHSADRDSSPSVAACSDTAGVPARRSSGHRFTVVR